MDRRDNIGEKSDLARRVLRLMVVLAASSLIAWLLTSFDAGPRSPLFETVAVARAEAGERAESDLGRLRLLTRCVGFVRTNYVVPGRVKPVPMLIGALKAAEALVPDLMVTPDADEPERATSVVVRIGDQTRTFGVGKLADLYEMNWKLLDIFDFISRHLPPDVKADEVEYAAINGLLSPLDEHSVYLPPRAYKEMQLDTQGRFGGLGIVITTRKGLVTIVSVLPGTPSSKAGLRSGDRILEIGDESTMNMQLNDAVGKLRGEPGTPVTILVQRPEWTEPRAFAMVRAEIHIQSVSTEALGNGIGYARIRHFQEDTTSELGRQLGDLKKKGSLEGLVLDLRQNPGGLLEQAVEVGNLFIRKGVLVVTSGEGNRTRQEYRADGDAGFADLPLVVLVDGGSASAAEIVAGALKGDDRAPLIGDTTFGKGTVQVMYEVGDGALKLTVAQYLTPGDISIQGVGVTPDIDLEPVVVGTGRITLGVADSRRERDPNRLLEAFGKVANDVPSAHVPFLRDEGEAKEDRDDADEEEPPLKDDERFERDEWIDLAQTLARASRSATRAGEIKEGAEALREWTAAQDARIATALKDRGIDWSAGPVQPGASVKVSWGIDRGQPLPAGSKVKLKLTARNDGADPLFRVHCLTGSDNAAFDEREFVFGRIGPGESVTREVPVTVPKESWDRLDQVTFRLYQGDFEMTRPEPVKVAVRTLLRPRFAYSWQVQDGGGNGDGQLGPGESAGIVVDVSNVGEGVAQKVLVTLRNKSGEGVYVRDGRVTLRNGIPIGRCAQARFSIELKRDLAAQSVTFEVGILDLALHEFLSEEIQVPVVRAAAARFEARPEALRTVRDGVPILAAAAEGAPALLEVPGNYFLRSSGRLGEFCKVDLDEGRFAFVRASDVETVHGVVRYSALPEAPVPRFVQPAMDVAFQGAAGSGALHVAGQVKFPARPGEARRKVLIFRGSDKVYFWTRKGPATDATVPVESTVPLRKGRNDIAVYAVEGKDRSTVRRYTVYSDTGPGAAETARGAGAGGAR
jgi:carboxyl-terminal processing protease